MTRQPVIAATIDRLISGWIKRLKGRPRETHLHPVYGGLYYWSEREYQWSLFDHCRRHANEYGLGSKWWVHAEGTIARPQYSRWRSPHRGDIVVVDHGALRAKYRRWDEGEEWTEYFPLEAVIELKLIWPGSGRQYYREHLAYDIKKINDTVKDGQARVGYLVLLDGVDRHGRPYYSTEDLKRLKGKSKVTIFHWPAGSKPVDRGWTIDSRIEKI